MKIYFFAANSIPIHARSLEERPLGGTETGLIRVSEQLQQRGHDVVVVTSHPEPPESPPGSARFVSARNAGSLGPCDVLVAVQDWWPVFSGIPAGKRTYWTGDGPDQFLTFGIGDRRIQQRIDVLFVVSEWHREVLCGYSGFPREKACIVRNGVHPPWFAGEEQRNRKRLLFTSAPYRGLDVALQCYRSLKARHPDLSFDIFSGLDLYRRGENIKGPEAMHEEQLRRLRRLIEQTPNCTLHGNVTQAQLAREYLRSGLFFYPGTVPETSCITVIEAKAGGCPIVVSALGALPETTGEAGLAVKGKPGTEAFQQQFCEAADRLLSDDALWQRCSSAGRASVEADYHWSHVADRMEAALTESA